MTAIDTRFLHVANGTCTTRLIEAAGIPGRSSIWADPLYEGPVPGGLTDSELLDVRARHLAGPVGFDLVTWGGADASLDPANDLRQWRAAIDRRDAYDELILWFEHDLFDQLNLIQLLAWIHDHLPRATPVSLVCIGSFPGRSDFKGLGQLTPAELSSLFETRQRVTDSQYAMAGRAWRAFREPSPEALERLLEADTSPLPYLAPALNRLLQEYPWTTDGLTRTERRLLELARASEMPLSKAFVRMHDGETVYYVTDASLAVMAADLSRTSPALLTLSPTETAEADVLRGSMALTEAGRAVLSGAQDRIALCGIDRWIGGVHLQSGRGTWRWDDTRRRVVRM